MRSNNEPQEVSRGRSTVEKKKNGKKQKKIKKKKNKKKKNLKKIRCNQHPHEVRLARSTGGKKTGKGRTIVSPN